MIEFEFGQASYTGERDYQEDMCRFERLKEASLRRNGAASGQAAGAVLAVLADGMGGHAGGAVASRTVCERFVQAFMSGHQRAENTADRNAQSLFNALQESNDAIQAQVGSNPGLKGMGSTLVAVRFDRRGMIWVSVGDSPLYAFRGGKVEQINADHSLAPLLDRMVEQRELSREEAENHPQRNALRSAVMGGKLELVDRRGDFLALKAGEWIVLASDGIETLTTQQIGEVIKAEYMKGAQGVADALVEAVRRKRSPFQDNTTVMVIRPYEGETRNGFRPSLSLGRATGLESVTDIVTASPQLIKQGAVALLVLAIVVWVGVQLSLLLTGGGTTTAAIPPAAGPKPGEAATVTPQGGGATSPGNTPPPGGSAAPGSVTPPGGTVPQQVAPDTRRDGVERRPEQTSPRNSGRPPQTRRESGQREAPKNPEAAPKNGSEPAPAIAPADKAEGSQTAKKESEALKRALDKSTDSP